MDDGRLTAALADPSVHLDRVTATIASLADDCPDEQEILATFDALAAEAPTDLDGLLGHVFGTLGFRGNAERYYAPFNSLIHLVLDRRLGNPLSLAVVATEIGRRVGVRLTPVGMPGHVLLGEPQQRRWFDPFAGGRALDLDECATLFHRALPDQPFDVAVLEPMTPRAVASRMLQNLRVASLRNGDLSFVARVLYYRVAIPDSPVKDRVELANVLGALGRFDLAAEQHDLLASLRPGSADDHRLAATRQRARNN